MSYSPERLMELADLVACDMGRDEDDAANALRAYADTLRQQAARVDAGMVEALRFYADKHHFMLGDEDAWDTVSGELQNFWCDEAGTATVEDGAVARQALTAALAQNTQGDSEPVARAWDEGYRQGVTDERTSDASIGIAGFDAKVEPARENPYRKRLHAERARVPDVDAMVSRFLGWRLPADFAPDGGVSFNPPTNPLLWPTGTCLLNDPQASAMFKYVLAAALAQNTQGIGEAVQDDPIGVIVPRFAGHSIATLFDESLPVGTKLYLHAERARVPDDMPDRVGMDAYDTGYARGWNACRLASFPGHSTASPCTAQDAGDAAAPSKPQDAGEVGHG